MGCAPLAFVYANHFHFLVYWIERGIYYWEEYLLRREVYIHVTGQRRAMATLCLYRAANLYQGQSAPDRSGYLYSFGYDHQRIFRVYFYSPG